MSKPATPASRTALVPAPSADLAERLRAFAEIGSDWFWEKDSALRFSYMSDVIDGPVSSFAADFLGRRIDEVDLPGFDEVDWRPLLSALALRAPFRDFRFIRRTPQGIRHLCVSGMPLFDGDGGFLGYRGTGRDLTKETVAEERAATAQTRLNEAIESIPESFALFDREDRLVLCNSRHREIHAAVAHLLVPGTPFEEICRAIARAEQPAGAPGREEDWVQDRLRRHAAADKFAVEERQIGDGWYQISDRRTRDGSSVVVQTEITAVKRREQELAEKTALLRATLDHMDQGLLVLDAELRIRVWNDRWLELLQISREIVAVGVPFERLMRRAARRGDYGPGDIDELVARRMEQFSKAGPRVTHIHKTPTRLVEVRRALMPDGSRLFTYADITEEKRVEADLRRAKDEAEMASRSKTEFLANMSHELRTPLNAIIGFSDILMGQIFGALGDPRYTDYARDIRDSGLHLLNLINDVLDVSKVEFGRVELTEEPVDVAAVVESCARLMRDRADGAGVLVVRALPPGLPQIKGDSRRLKQILLNLLSNAVKFTPSGGRVTVRAASDGDGFRIAVEDTGIGIAKEDLETALRPFGQIDSRLARKYQGTGLGLPLARSMAELHGGRLELNSAPGQGTTAVIWLPPTRIIGS